MAGLDVSLRGVDGDPTACIAELSGVIDGTTVVKFQESLEDITKRGARKLILDMAKVRYVNSTGLGALVKYADKCKNAGGGMALTKVTAKVKIVIEMLGLQAFFEICMDERQALEALARRGGAPEAPPAPAYAPPPPRAPAPPPPQAAPPVEPPAFAPARAAAPPPPPPPPTPAAAPAAGQVYACQSCGIGVEVPAPGNWKCPRCGALIAAKPDGSVRFLAPVKPSPFELSINCSREGAEALKQFVGVVAQPVLAPQVLESVKTAVGEVAQVIASTAYGHDPKATYHVLVETTPSEVRIKVADHGKTLDSTRMEAYFPQATRAMSEFECRPHPRGGNIIRMVRKR
jgi:anti-anti-sigma factor